MSHNFAGHCLSTVLKRGHQVIGQEFSDELITRIATAVEERAEPVSQCAFPASLRLARLEGSQWQPQRYVLSYSEHVPQFCWTLFVDGAKKGACR